MSDTARVRALIVEDEPLARQVLREGMAGVAWLECVGEAADGRTAVLRIDELRPDLVFLDVEMPELNGLQVLERIEHRPAVVFTTAYDHYAVAAFELEALDYLLKPFSRKRLHVALERVRRRLVLDDVPASSAESDVERGRRALAEGDAAESSAERPLERLFARKGERIVPLTVASLVRCEAADDYVRLHTDDGARFLVHLTLAELERRLDPRRFVRVHRSHLVNLDALAELRPHDERRLRLTLSDGSTVIASRDASRKLREQIL